MRFYHFTKDCPLTLSDRLVWSYLIYRSRVNGAATQQRVADALRLSATLTVKPALTRLADLQLVQKREDGWFACPPAGEAAGWISTRTTGAGGKWQDRLASAPFKLPSRACPWRTSDVLLWSVVTRLAKEILSYNRLGALVPLPDRSLRACINGWQRDGYLRVTYRRGKAFRVAVLKELPEEWFAPATPPAQAVPTPTQITPEPTPPQVEIPEYIRYGYLKDMVSQQMPDSLVRELLALMLALHHSDRVERQYGHPRYLLNDLIEAANREHAKNHDNNKAKHPGYLLRYKLRELVKQHCPQAVATQPPAQPRSEPLALPDPTTREGSRADAQPMPLEAGLSKYGCAEIEREFENLPFLGRDAFMPL
jgi:hypothetical protein